MQYKAVALAALLILSFSEVVSAQAVDVGKSILTSQFVLAPVLDSTQPLVPIDPPILAPAIDQRMDQPAHDDRTNKKHTVVDKTKSPDRKRSSWLKRTFLGK